MLADDRCPLDGLLGACEADRFAAHRYVHVEVSRLLDGLVAVTELRVAVHHVGQRRDRSRRDRQGRAGYLPSKRNEGGSYAQYGYSSDEAKLRPLTKVHPETGRSNLLIGRHAHDIVGLNRAESEALLDGLNDWACESPRSYHHEWNVGDTVVWDNRRLMHRATPFDLTEPRRMCTPGSLANARAS